MKQQLKDQTSRMKQMMNLSEGMDSLSNKVQPYSKFDNPEELLKSVNDRLITAVQLQQWPLVEEIASDVYNYFKNKKDTGLKSKLKSLRDKISTKPDWV